MPGSAPSADIFADRLLQQRAPLREAPLERIGIAQARHDHSQTGAGGRRHDRGPGPAPTPGWRAPGPLGRGTGLPRRLWTTIGVAPRPSSVARRSASSPWRRPSAKAPSTLKVMRQPRLGLDPQVCTGHARRPVRRLHVPPQQLGRPAEVADDIVCLPQVIGCFHLQGALAELGREREGLPGPPQWRRRGLP